MNISKIGKSLILGSAIALTLAPMNPQSAKASNKARCEQAEQAVKANTRNIKEFFEGRKFDRVRVNGAFVTVKGCKVRIGFRGSIRRAFKTRKARGHFTADASGSGISVCLRRIAARNLKVNTMGGVQESGIKIRMRLSGRRCFSLL